MSALFAPTAVQQKVLDELAEIRPEYDRLRAELDAVQLRQRKAWVRGKKHGVPATEMARAQGAKEKDVPMRAEAINQVIRDAERKAAAKK